MATRAQLLQLWDDVQRGGVPVVHRRPPGGPVVLHATVEVGLGAYYFSLMAGGRWVHAATSTAGRTVRGVGTCAYEPLVQWLEEHCVAL